MRCFRVPIGRKMLRAVVTTLVAATGSLAVAQDYPTREIRAICNFPAGTGADVYVRYFADKLSALAGKPVIVENRSGALGNIGTEAAARAKPDGYTIYVAPASSSHAAAYHIFKKVSFDPVKDFMPITTLAQLGFVLVVDPKTPFKNVAELTAHLLAKGDKASFGVGAPTGVVAAELYKKIAAFPARRVQYKEMQTPMNDLIAGNLDFIYGDPVFALEHVRAGRLRALAVTTPGRMGAMPDVPNMEEAGVKGFGQLTAWWAVFLPAKSPEPFARKLEGWFNQIVATEETKKFLQNLGADPLPGNAKLVSELLDRDLKAWGEYVKLAGIVPQ